MPMSFPAPRKSGFTAKDMAVSCGCTVERTKVAA
jgi:hypothetical protein